MRIFQGFPATRRTASSEEMAYSTSQRSGHCSKLRKETTPRFDRNVRGKHIRTPLHMISDIYNPHFQIIRSESRSSKFPGHSLQKCQIIALYPRDTPIHITKLPMMIHTRIPSSLKSLGSSLQGSLSNNSTMQYRNSNRALAPAAPCTQVKI